MVYQTLQEGVFVIHALKGYEEHERRIIELFTENNISFEFVTDGDPSCFNDEIINTYFTSDIKTKLSDGVLSCTLNHILTYKKIIDRNLKYAIIFENDPFFLGNFVKDLYKIESEIRNLEKGFIISLENTTLRTPSVWVTKKDKYIYQAKSCRHCGAYIIDRQGAINIMNEIFTNKCNNVIDWWIDDVIRRRIVKVHWVHPPMVEEGSHNGQMNSSISTKPKSYYRQFAWKMQKFYKNYIVRLFPNDYIIR
ncbi:glycosyl transferase family 25 (plasmid) [Emticicia oligotrophica DSM 17448]|uniref:Glycosyl transferase family 25 n=1 Tax=Emticicia oligotrophica (strain DSM 17448 / CIP 109782 / MTCC 6937 / GPTSA100-15) TaxID=929562 RepID=A0ABM5N7K8_EMTOG|nr:glycosyltransferase family 25 protein [Emticicia oligotrophica]AFK05537.1 glycosyl transferase family 25 [Emticicia oligotrophica DSM 17448]